MVVFYNESVLQKGGYVDKVDQGNSLFIEGELVMDTPYSLKADAATRLVYLQFEDRLLIQFNFEQAFLLSMDLQRVMTEATEQHQLTLPLHKKLLSFMQSKH